MVVLVANRAPPELIQWVIKSPNLLLMAEISRPTTWDGAETL